MRWLLMSMCLCAFLSFSQDEITSFYIQEIPQLSNQVSDTIPASVRGTFAQKEDSTKQIVFERDSIVFSKVLTSFLTLDQVKDRSEWYLSDGRLYGVKKDEGLVYIEDNDTIYFNLPLTYTKFQSAKTDKYRIDFLDAKTMVMYEKAEHGWTVNSLINFSDNGLDLRPFDHDYVVDKIEKWNTVNQKTVNGYRTFMAKPSSKELLDILNDKRAFAHTIAYIKLID